MSVINQLASAQGRQDDTPNRELAKHLAEAQDREGIQVLVGNIANDDPAIQSDCIKTLYEVGYLEPALIADHWETFLGLLASKNNRMVWGGMIALSTIAHLRASDLFPHADELKKVVRSGSVITQDSGIKTLSVIAAQGDDTRAALLPFLFDTLKSCRAKDLPKHAAAVFGALDDHSRDRFIKLLEARLPDLSENQQKRLRKTVKKAQQS